MANEVDKQIEVVEGNITQDQAKEPDYVPVYQVYENTRIPISKAVGKLWKHRFDECEKFLKNSGDKERWDEAIAYYQNDQSGDESRSSRLSGLSTGRDKEDNYASENIIFANVSALVPSTYAKNPDIEVTSTKSADEGKGKLFEKLVDTLFAKKITPGINIKPKMRRAVVTTTLTNVSYLLIDYVRKEDSSEQVVAEIEKLSKELQEAKTQNEVKEIEGKLQALEHKISILTPSGPRLSFRMPHMVFGDPNRDGQEITDGDFVIIGDYVRTDFLRSVYGKKDENGEWISIYKPTHVLLGESNSQGHDEDITNFSLLGDKAEYSQYGYKDQESFLSDCRTLCWFVWDKVTRRVFMFNNDDWSWPIWVWDDPLKLSRFFPIFELRYYTDPVLANGKSEVMYYLDQQDEINASNKERARMRRWAMSKIFVNSANTKDASAIEKFLRSSSSDLVYALDIPEGKRLSDIIGAFPAPSTQFEGLFDTKPLFEGINRLSSVTPTLQNAQFKTNTTNRAIETYESSTQTRLDEKIDAIEETLGDIATALLELCVQFMAEEEVIDLLGEDFVTQNGGWEQMEVSEFNKRYEFNIIGGSTLKPTGKTKKEQAMQLGQVLGQFANASPMLVIVLLKMMQRAFGDDVVITPEEWDMIVNSTTQQMQRGSAQQGAGQQPQQPQGGQQQQPQQEGGDTNAVMSQVEQIIDQLPPEAKKFLGAGIAKGIPLKQLVMQLTQAAQQQTQQRPQ